ncbi:MAG: hypothetical protein RJA75_94 [Actinomycetota bacterium]|jgi:hypothetical protein
MQITKLRWSKAILLASSFSLVLGSVVVPAVQATTSNPTPVCNATGTSCTINFPYSGDSYIWSPPTDVRSMSISLAGAQGGRFGGNGAKATATFKTIPTTPLYIFVGGQGSSGNGAAGGFNGGGAAGYGHNDEGSGGGATDIRTSPYLTDRIAVAGGGGGTGGWVGGAGAPGSGTTGTGGGNGQGLGGGAGTPVSGGAGGASNGSLTSPGSAGTIGVGGAGGRANTPSSTVAGGGGGGGGYFGGGGGGADTDPSGTDGGGGGSGSSFINATKFQTATYTAAWQSANGAASITYNYGPSVTYFSGPSSPSKATSPVFNIAFGQSVTGLTADDFVISGTAQGCYISTLTGSGANYAAAVTGCSDGTITLTLKADTVFGNAIGPVRSYSTTLITLDRTVPEIGSLTKQTSSNSLIIYKAIFSEPVSGLVADNTDWLVKGNGCVIQSMTGSGAQYTITISSCVDGELAGLVLNSLAVQDAAGNIGPSLLNQTEVTKIDTTAPVLRVTDITAPGAAGSPKWVFDSEEPVTGMTAAKFTLSGTAPTCELNYSVVRENLGWQISLEGCGTGTTQVVLAANSVTDSSGNIGPISALPSNIIEITPDEVVNEVLDAAGQPTGAVVNNPGAINTEQQIERARLLSEKELLLGEVQQVNKASDVNSSLAKELEGTKALDVVGEDWRSTMLFLLLALALTLSAFAAGSSVRSRRRH